MFVCQFNTEFLQKHTNQFRFSHPQTDNKKGKIVYNRRFISTFSWCCSRLVCYCCFLFFWRKLSLFRCWISFVTAFALTKRIWRSCRIVSQRISFAQIKNWSHTRFVFIVCCYLLVAAFCFRSFFLLHTNALSNRNGNDDTWFISVVAISHTYTQWVFTIWFYYFLQWNECANIRWLKITRIRTQVSLHRWFILVRRIRPLFLCV